MQTVSSIVDLTRLSVGTVQENVSVCDAVSYMSEAGVPAVLVLNDDRRVVGIMTEHDVLSRVIAAELDPHEVTVAEVMTPELVTISPRASLEEAMNLITEYRYRQLLVAEGDEILGLITIAELTKSLLSDREALIGDLTYYITHG